MISYSLGGGPCLTLIVGATDGYTLIVITGVRSLVSKVEMNFSIRHLQESRFPATVIESVITIKHSNVITPSLSVICASLQMDAKQTVSRIRS